MFLIKTLHFKSVSVDDRIVIQDNELEIFWNVKGCHKIKINGIGIFPGNSHGLKFIFTNRHNPIEITFYGIAKELKKKIRIDNIKIDLLNKFVATTEIPVAIEVPYNKQKLEVKFLSDNLKVQIQNVTFDKVQIQNVTFDKVQLQNVTFDFEPFNIENYKQVKTN